MKRTPESFLIQVEMPVIFLIGAFLVAAAAVSVQGLWQIATAVLFPASIVVVVLALGAAARYCHRWP